MRRSAFLTTLLPLICICFDILLGALGDVGTAKYFAPPYLPTQCNGTDKNQFPTDGYFAAVSEGLWDNGGACGRKYRMRCISGSYQWNQSRYRPYPYYGPCTGRYIVVLVLDRCREDPCPTTMTLPLKAFRALSKYRISFKINVEFTQI